MELLFTPQIGNEELAELLGFLDIDIKYKKLSSKLITATNDVIALVGQEMYTLALAEYKKTIDQNNDLIFHMRYPIAIQAYRKFAPHNDVSHTNKGRINRVEENEKTPFEWMIDLDNKALERSYYEALDNLIKYLDKNIDTWKETDAYEKTHNLFLRTAEQFDDFFPIGNSRLILLKLAPGIRKAEDNEIKPRIGSTLFATMKQQLKDNSEEINEELLYKIREACVYRSMAWAMQRLSVQLFPEGVLQGFVSDRMTINARKPSEKSETAATAQYFNADADIVLREIESIITKLSAVDIIVEPITFNPDIDDKFLTL